MPKYKKCPRCDINYILEEKEYCNICEAEMRGVTFDEVIDDEEVELCPKCRINYLGEGETICESCLANSIDDGKEPVVVWDKEEEIEEVVDEDDIIMPDEVSLEGLAEEESWEESEDGEEIIIDDDVEGLDDELDDIDDIDDEDELDDEEDDLDSDE